MTDNDWDEFKSMLFNLFKRPGSEQMPLNADQLRVWKSRVLSLPMHEATAAMNDYYTSAKGSTPRLSDYLKHVRQSRDERVVNRDTERVTVWERYRRDMAAAAPNRRDRILSMTDSETEVQHHKNSFMNSFPIYGPEGSKSMYDNWQRAVENCDGERVEYDPEHWANRLGVLSTGRQK